MRVVTFGSDKQHPLTLAALAVVRDLPGVEHVDHVTTDDRRELLRAPRTEAYRRHVAALEPDLLVSAAYGRILPQEVLSAAAVGAINVHPSLLPEYRGALAVWWALYEGSPRVGVTIHEMTLPVDAGPILAQAELAIGAHDDPLDVRQKLGELARPLLRDTLQRIRQSGRLDGTPQPAGGFYRSTPDKELRRLELDWSQTPAEIIRRNRLFPAHGNIAAGSSRISVRSIVEASPTDRPPGAVLRRRPKSIDVAVGGGGSIRVSFGHPLRSWTKLLLLHLTTRNLRRLPPPGPA